MHRLSGDANPCFSAAKSAEAVRALLHPLLERGHECAVDAYVVVEARRNLAAKSFRKLWQYSTTACFG